MDILYENIKRLRKERKMSQEELAKLTGYTDRSSIAKIERGEVDLNQSKIQAFANAFNVSPQYLMGYPEATANVLPNSPHEAVRFLLEQPMIADFGGYDLSTMSDEQIVDFANEIAAMIQFAATHHYAKRKE